MKSIIKLLIFFFTFSFYGQNDTLAIIKHTEKDLIVPKQKKVLFRGVVNELEIEVPNSKSFKITGDYIKLVKDNIYSCFPGKGDNTTINIEITLKNNKKIIEKHVFEIRNLKRAITCFNYTKADTVLRFPKKSFKDGKVTVISPDKNFDLKIKVIRFSLKIPGRNSIIVNGDTIDEKTYQDIIKYSFKGNQIIISDIKVQLYNWSGCFLVNPMVIEVY